MKGKMSVITKSEQKTENEALHSVAEFLSSFTASVNNNFPKAFPGHSVVLQQGSALCLY
jgi:hypothetical protein